MNSLKLGHHQAESLYRGQRQWTQVAYPPYDPNTPLKKHYTLWQNARQAVHCTIMGHNIKMHSNQLRTTQTTGQCKDPPWGYTHGLSCRSWKHPQKRQRSACSSSSSSSSSNTQQRRQAACSVWREVMRRVKKI